MKKLNDMLRQAAIALEDAEDTLCAVDAETGDGDHGTTMAKIARALMDVAESGTTNVFSEASNSIMKLNGGSAGPLWAIMFDGMGEAFDGSEELSPALVRKIIAGALESLKSVSDAKPGDKTMMDALIPAVEAAQSAPDDVKAILEAAARAAEKGAEATANMVAKYGQAKNMRELSLGHRDAGAVGVAIFARAVADAAKD
ncbi:MAG: DAK2 domain-containing protein [Oscillospiraceae bacterium]|jgi:dihydroxyacetone kinase-like protein